MMEKRKTSPYVYRKDGSTYIVVNDWVRRLMPKHMDVEAKLADMDASGIGMTALSINDPGPELFGKEGPAVARLVNDAIARNREEALRPVLWADGAAASGYRRIAVGDGALREQARDERYPALLEPRRHVS